MKTNEMAVEYNKLVLLNWKVIYFLVVGLKKNLDLHVDNAAVFPKADFLILLCLRPDYQKIAETSFSDVDEAVKSLQQETIDILKMPLFTHDIPDSFKLRNGESRVTGRTCILKKGIQGYEANFNFFDTKPVSKQAETALNIFKEKLVSNKKSIKLETGDLLIIDNNRALHSRSSYPALLDGKDRWLQRIYVTRNLKNGYQENQKNYRVFNPVSISSVPNDWGNV